MRMPERVEVEAGEVACGYEGEEGHTEEGQLSRSSVMSTTLTKK